MDDIINVAGHRLSTKQIEIVSALHCSCVYIHTHDVHLGAHEHTYMHTDMYTPGPHTYAFGCSYTQNINMETHSNIHTCTYENT